MPDAAGHEFPADGGHDRKHRHGGGARVELTAGRKSVGLRNRVVTETEQPSR